MQGFPGPPTSLKFENVFDDWSLVRCYDLSRHATRHTFSQNEDVVPKGEDEVAPPTELRPLMRALIAPHVSESARVRDVYSDSR